MITSEQRKQIERMAYDAVKALTGEQLKVKLDYYRNVDMQGDKIKSGRFRVKIENYLSTYSSFFIAINDYAITSLMPKYKDE